MARSEFSIIEHFFNQHRIKRDDVVLGIGDDAALTRVPPGMNLVTTVDTLVNNIHFPSTTPAMAIGHKVLAVNLSDLAAMGAEPAWATLAITMPDINEMWLRGFCDGFFELAQQFNVQLVGGDTTQGPLCISVQLMGWVPEGKALTRGGAKPGDILYVSGTLGDAAVGLVLQQTPHNMPELNQAERTFFLTKLNEPQPRNLLGLSLRGIASAAIDVSDGLLADLNHVLTSSGVGATIEWQHVPSSEPMCKLAATRDVQSYVLSGGDDYELCFTAPAIYQQQIQQLARQLNVIVTPIGVIESTNGLRMTYNGVTQSMNPLGFEHFTH